MNKYIEIENCLPFLFIDSRIFVHLGLHSLPPCFVVQIFLLININAGDELLQVLTENSVRRALELKL